MRGGACRACGASIVWATTEKGKAQPLDPRPEKRIVVDAHDIARVVNTFMPHHATCPRAAEFRRKPTPAGTAVANVLKGTKPSE